MTWSRTLLVLLSLNLLAHTLAGCTTLIDVPITHIVMVNGRGNPVDPTGNAGCWKKPRLCTDPRQQGRHVWALPMDYPEMERGSPETAPPSPDAPLGLYERYLNRLFADLSNHPPDKDGKRRVLIFIHGGLNTQVRTVERATELWEKIAGEGYFPIFINWQSSLFSSYADHLFNIRQGESWEVKGWVLMPFYFISDVARSIARAPIVWSFELKNEIASWPAVTTQTQTEVNHLATELAREYDATKDNPPKNVLRISFDHGKDYDPVDRRGYGDRALAAVTGFLTVPTKMLSSMFIDAFGKSAWDTMLRRTHMLYHTDREFSDSEQIMNESGKQEDKAKRSSHIKPDGALSVFMRRLQNVVISQGGPGKWDITLVGHSMGTIVLNQLIREFGVATVKDGSGQDMEVILPFDNIVYMAAAATVRDYQDSVFPYMMKRNDCVHPEKNNCTRMYHHMLHQKAELLERFDLGIPYLDLPPRGSLLVWIDDFLSNPETPLDRTVGRFDNFIVAVHDMPDELRNRIHVKVSNVGDPKKGPQEHGDFTKYFKFWKSQCWWPPGPDFPEGCYSP